MSDLQRKKAQDKITSTFIWTFKKGDNIIYNLDILWSLYSARKNARLKNEEFHYFNKPCTIIIVSIIECILDDFITRIKQRVYDPLPNITSDVAMQIQNGKLDKLTHYLDQIKKHQIFSKNDKFYDDLQSIRKLRNKIHIQDSSKDESTDFTNENLVLAQKLLVHVLKKMYEQYPRNGEALTFDDFPFPWQSKYGEK